MRQGCQPHNALVLAIKAAVDLSNERGQNVLVGSTRFLSDLGGSQPCRPTTGCERHEVGEQHRRRHRHERRRRHDGCVHDAELAGHRRPRQSSEEEAERDAHHGGDQGDGRGLPPDRARDLTGGEPHRAQDGEIDPTAAYGDDQRVPHGDRGQQAQEAGQRERRRRRVTEGTLPGSGDAGEAVLGEQRADAERGLITRTVEVRVTRSSRWNARSSARKGSARRSHHGPESPRRHRGVAAFDELRGQVLGVDRAVRQQRPRRLRNDDLPRRGQLLQPLTQVHRIAHD